MSRRTNAEAAARDGDLLALAGQSNKAIAAAVGWTEGQVAGRLRRLRAAGHVFERPLPLRAKRAAEGTARWPDEQVAQLRVLWPDTSIEKAEIARRLGVTIDSVQAKAQALGIRRQFVWHPPRDGSKPGPKRLTPLALDRPLKPPPRPVQAVQATAAPYIPPPKYGRVTSCCWPIGEPGTREFRMCDAPSEPGRPYCASHVRHAYAPIRRRADPRATVAELAGVS